MENIFVRFLRIVWIANALYSISLAYDEYSTGYYDTVEMVWKMPILSIAYFLIMGIGVVTLQYILLGSINPMKLIKDINVID